MPDYDLSGSILAFLSEVINLLPRPLEAPYAWIKRTRGIGYKSYYDSVRGLKKRGMVTVVKREGKVFIELTAKGSLEALLAKAGIEKKAIWDRKWRLCIFDIPEAAHLQRDYFRRLLKQHGFYKLQGSVFISPYSLNRQAMEYLEKTGLNKYIRFLKVEEMDNDKDIRKYFNIK